MSVATALPNALRIAGDSHVGKVRSANEDSLIVEPRLGLYAVLDGMGGANAGDVASQLARDTIREVVLQRRGTLAPKQLLEAAIQGGSTAVFNAAQANREHHGMGTTVVACLVVDPRNVVVGHAGDSRAYLLRAGRLQALTRDHTIVEELVDRGLLSPEEAERHPYKNVLSRNLGARPETRVDLVEVALEPGDRLLLCSDGLYGYAAGEAIQYLLGSGDAPDQVCRDLIDLALRGGGGDNVSTIVLEVPAAGASSTQVVRTRGAIAWWQKHPRFLQVAKERGLTRNPIVRGLAPEEALELIGSSLCQAVYHDLEKSTGVNVWTFAQNLAGAWFERGGEWAAVRGLIDILGMSARAVVDEIRGVDPQLGFLLDVAVSRALVVAELALGGLLAERLRQVDGELIQLHSSLLESVIEPSTSGSLTALTTGAEESLGETGERFVERPTIPFLRPDRPVTGSGVSNELLDAIGKTVTIARARTSPRAELVKQVLGALETIATEGGESFATAVLVARELYGVRSVDDAGIMPLFDALDQARIITASSVHQIQTTEANRAKVLRALSTAHQRLVGATTGLVLESVAPFSDRLREVQSVTVDLREQVARAEKWRADLERRFATIVDPSLPWGARGSTDW
ncbi:MAG: PP2C family protein-serine/threonine phosphatase [Kofleriaceae bacterium]